MFPFVGGSDTRLLTPRGIYPQLTTLRTKSGESSDCLKSSHALSVSVSLARCDTCTHNTVICVVVVYLGGAVQDIFVPLMLIQNVPTISLFFSHFSVINIQPRTATAVSNHYLHHTSDFLHSPKQFSVTINTGLVSSRRSIDFGAPRHTSAPQDQHLPTSSLVSLTLK